MMRLLILPKRNYLVKKVDEKFHSNEGYLTPAQLQAESGTAVITSKGVEGLILDPGFVDIFDRLPRKAQIMLPKDIGWIVSATGLDKTKTVVDAGSGSGSSASLLARYAKRVYSYDVREDHITMAKENAERLGVTNVSFDLHDVTQGIPKKDVFLIVLDLPQPWDAIASAAKAVAVGGYVFTYSPSITQSQQAVIKAKENNLDHLTTIELIERHWEVDERRCRPAHGALGHTGFLSMFRRYKK